MKKLVIRLAILAAVVSAGWYGYKMFQSLPARTVQVPSTKVRQSDVVMRSYARGELRAVRSATLIAPNLFGTVQVTRMASLGSVAREKNLVVEFDDAELLSRLEEKQLELDQIDEQVKKAEADLAIRNNQDQVELLRAKYGVRRSELEVKRNELLPQIDRRKNELNLDETKRRLTQLQSDIQSRLQQAQAEMAVLRERRNKGVMEMSREKMRLSQVKLLSPMTGLVAVRQNRTGMYFPGMTIPDIREGDQIQPGIPVADILDLSELEVVAKIGEIDRASLKEGQEVLMKLDAVAGKTFHGAIKSMSGTATANVFSGDPAKKFDVIFSIDMKELLEGLGAKPDQIKKVMATAESNRRKPQTATFRPPMMMAGAGGGAPEGAGAGMGGGGGMTPPTAQAATPPGGGESRGGGRAAAGGQGAAGGQRGAAGGTALASVAGAPATPGERGGGPRGESGGRGGPGGPGGFGGPRLIGGFTPKEIEEAQLPPSVEADNQLEVLLRPGLLADVEIILEKLPNATNVPNSSVFEKNGKQIVYVRNGKKWDERAIKTLKRSESVTVIAGGLKPGEIIAVSDPTARPGDKKKDKSGGAVGSMPGGKS